jgi:serine/threonine protein kinase
MAKELTTVPGQTTFTQIHQTFADGKKGDFDLRFKGGVLYTHSKYQAHGSSNASATARAAKKAAAPAEIRNALVNEFGAEFAHRIMTNVQSKHGIDLRANISRSDLDKIQDAIVDHQLTYTTKPTGGTLSGVAEVVAKAIVANPNNPAAMATKIATEFKNEARLNHMLTAPQASPKQFEGLVASKLAAERLGKVDTTNFSKAEIKNITKQIAKQAATDVKVMMPQLCNSMGVTASGDRFILSRAGMDAIEQKRTAASTFHPMTSADLQGLANLGGNAAAMQLHFTNNPAAVLGLLATHNTLTDLTTALNQLATLPPGQTAAGLATQIMTAGGIQADPAGLLETTPARISAALNNSQALPGVGADLAYRVEVACVKEAKTTRLGGPALLAAANTVLKNDLAVTQKIPANLAHLTRAEMGQIAAVVNNPAQLKALIDGNADLKLKLTTTHSDDLKARLVLENLGGSTVDTAFNNVLAELPGAGATMRPDGSVGRVNVAGVDYVFNSKDFGDPAGMGEVMLMDKATPPAGQMVLKTVPMDANGKVDAKKFEQLAKEAKLQSWLSGNPDVVHTLDTIRIGDQMYIAMEYCPGGSLNNLMVYGNLDHVATAINMDPRMQMAMKLSVVEDMLAPLASVSAGANTIVHHDIKPGNFFMRDDGSLALADFGTASAGATSNNYMVVDNPEQKSPELAKNASLGPPYAAVGAKADLFALGIAAERFLLGRDIHGQASRYNSERLDMLSGLLDHANGPVIPPAPQQGSANFAAEQKAHDLAVHQQTLMANAGINFYNNEPWLHDPATANPVKGMINGMTAADPANRSTAALSQLTTPFNVTADQTLKTDLRLLTALVNKMPVTTDPQTDMVTVAFADAAQRAEYNRLQAKIAPQLAAVDPALWTSMGL